MLALPAGTIYGRTNVRNGGIRVDKRAAGLEHGSARGVKFMVRVDQKEYIQCFLQNRIRHVVLFAEMVHLVQESVQCLD